MTPFTITKEDVAACTSEAVLRLWHERFHSRYDDLISQVDAARRMGTFSRSRFPGAEREIATCEALMRHIERRGLALGFEPILQRKHHHQQIVDRYRALKADYEQLRAEYDALRMGRAA